MVGNATPMALLLEGGIRDGHVSQNRLIITIDIGWANDQDSHHSEFIPQTPDILAALLHRNEFQPKG